MLFWLNQRITSSRFASKIPLNPIGCGFEDQYKLCFIQPSENETKTIEYHSRAQSNFHNDLEKSIEALRKIGLSKDEIKEDVIKQLQRLLDNDR